MPDPRPQHRVPPGQTATARWPVLHYGAVPRVGLGSWRFRVFGRVARPVEWTYEQFAALPRVRSTGDIHCVTGWTRLDNVWDGVPYAEVRRRFEPLPDARFVMVHAAGGWTANLPLEDMEREGVLFATHHGGRPLTPEHGWPLRLVVPHLYFWKSAKWVVGLELMAADRAGFWERAGYHMRGDPWREERFG
jgi:DMSO/TMAO reductase YedYZ molybdopterin-dependent catalytic subunit